MVVLLLLLGLERLPIRSDAEHVLENLHVGSAVWVLLGVLEHLVHHLEDALERLGLRLRLGLGIGLPVWLSFLFIYVFPVFFVFLSFTFFFLFLLLSSSGWLLVAHYFERGKLHVSLRILTYQYFISLPLEFFHEIIVTGGAYFIKLPLTYT